MWLGSVLDMVCVCVLRESNLDKLFVKGIEGRSGSTLCTDGSFVAALAVLCCEQLMLRSCSSCGCWISESLVDGAF